MHVLVTGAAGFIGSHVTTGLLDAGYQVRALDGLLPPVHDEPVWPAWTDPRAEQVTVDLREADAVAAALSGIDAVVHQAALVGHGLDLQDLPKYAALNDLGTAVLLAGMAAAGIGDLVLASSMVVYGEGNYRCAEHGPAASIVRTRADLSAGQYEPRCPECAEPLLWDLVDESAPKHPQTVYASSKLAQEHYARAWARGSGGRAYLLRYHNVYGPRMPLDSPYSGVAALFRSRLAAGEPPLVFEDGRQMRDFVHVGDIARANLAALRALPQAPPGGLAVNVCSGQPRSVGWAAEILADELGGPAPTITGQARAADVRHVVADPALAARAIGFVARIDPETGFREFAHEPMGVSGTGLRPGG